MSPEISKRPTTIGPSCISKVQAWEDIEAWSVLPRCFFAELWFDKCAPSYNQPINANWQNNVAFAGGVLIKF